jgi:lysophospholipase L1-like esterase
VPRAVIRTIVLAIGTLCAGASPIGAAADQRYRSTPPSKAPAVRSLPARLAVYRQNETSLLMADFGQQYVYAQANQAVPLPTKGEARIVFLGDSITDFWDLAAFFPGKPYINRGISGQVTPQMVVRFHADVVALRPAAVIILAGVNDVSGVLQAETERQIEANYEVMADLAAANHIKPIFTKLLPINRYNQSSHSTDNDRDAAPLLRLNKWLGAFCRRRGYKLIDYTAALGGPDGQLRPEYSIDGLHPNAAGYALMAPIAQTMIDAALREHDAAER